ncbi:GNAT family N-acetyltransferase [Defluviimonas sp. WL0002]|uniref:GNAT family N-acetyltransferase n=1 Tax=Albidovulum marisflavi TaxID=2984159 RepID=A0ABT2ZFI9_9RHOB|nr:GNAT family N-acetyltransferase [Defluviimonas sp. WL0002]MCV2869897.1 GNAT family N-acetyltransferase [Defluviimonas sp. WL0002]
MTGAVPALRFARLTEVPLGDLVAHMSDPRLRAHMPWLTGNWGEAEARAFVAAKEACWARDGLGHWAFLADGRYVGWGGFQRKGEEWDFGLVLRPQDFGLGLRITRTALDFARSDTRIPFVTFLLPPSRRNLGALYRMGAQAVGRQKHSGTAFLKFRLDTSSSPSTGSNCRQGWHS